MTSDKQTSSKSDADMWGAYSQAVETWTKSFQMMQEQATNAFKLYMQGFEQAMKTSNFEDMKKYNDLWQAFAKQFENSWSTKAWEDMWKNSNFTSFKEFSDHWQKIWQNFAKSAQESSKEAMDKLSKSYQS